MELAKMEDLDAIESPEDVLLKAVGYHLNR